MKKWICALLLAALLLAPAALAATIIEATMVYEDDDGNRVEQSVTSRELLGEIQEILAEAKRNPVAEIHHTMNSTLMCVTEDDVVDFAVATDGSAFIIDNTTEKPYAVGADDMDRLWEIFDEVNAGMGIEAEDAFAW